MSLISIRIVKPEILAQPAFACIHNILQRAAFACIQFAKSTPARRICPPHKSFFEFYTIQDHTANLLGELLALAFGLLGSDDHKQCSLYAATS